MGISEEEYLATSNLPPIIDTTLSWRPSIPCLILRRGFFADPDTGEPGRLTHPTKRGPAWSGNAAPQTGCPPVKPSAAAPGHW